MPIIKLAMGGLLLALPGLVAAAGETFSNAADMAFVQIPSGTFVMGTTKEQVDDILFEDSRNDEAAVADEMPAHRVTISRAFWLQRTEVTQAQWLRVMRTRPGEKQFWTRHDWKRLPVVGVSWQQAQAFIARLNAADARYRYRLPTEAEWEYAARAGDTGVRPFPLEQIRAHAWYFGGSGDRPMPVARLQPNAFGLYDMFGNAWEWVQDWYGSYPAEDQVDPAGPASGEQKVRRGGSYHCSPRLIRSAYRAPDAPDKHWPVIGFRLVAERR